MDRTEFFSLSVAIHALLLAAVFLMPAPFPAPKLPKYSGGFVYVEPVNLKKLRIKRSANTSVIPPRENYKTGSTKNIIPKLSRNISARSSTPAPSPDVSAERNVPRNSASPANTPEPKPAGRAPKTSSPPPPAPLPVPSPHPAGASPGMPKAGGLPSPRAPQPSPEIKAVAEKKIPSAYGVKTDRETLNFKYQKGWPAPGMARVRVNVLGTDEAGKVGWKAKADEPWLIISPSSGTAPGYINIGVNPKAAVGFYDATVSIIPSSPGIKGDEVEVTLMVLPKEKGKPYLPHFAYDDYMNGDCKVCHMPQELLPEPDFRLKPEFCTLCHNPSAMAKAFVVPSGGHPVGIKAGTGNTKLPARGTDPKGPRSDRMDTHLPDGRIVCITCHNVMEKPGDYGRTWEPASSDDGVNWWLYKGGWDGMGYIKPKVYLAEPVSRMPKKIREMRRMEASPSQYNYDETEGVIMFKKPLSKEYSVYVTLANPYLRVTTENNALCYDCHVENTHQGLNCLICHVIHGGGNAKAVSEAVRTPYGVKKVTFNGRAFTDGNGMGICDVCHALSGTHLKYKNKDCISCHNHKDGFN